MDQYKEKDIPELLKKSKKELTDIVKEYWGYKEDEQIMVIGKIERKSGKNYYKLLNISNKKGERLNHPVEYNDKDKELSVYIPTKFEPDNIAGGGCVKTKNKDANVSEFEPDNIAGGGWVQATLSISPMRELKKHNDPFLFQVIKKMNMLKALPNDFNIDIYKSESNCYIDKSIFDMVVENHKQETEKKREELIEENQKKREELIKKNQEVVKYNQAFKKENQVFKEENQALKEENQALRKDIDNKNNEKESILNEIDQHKEQHKNEVMAMQEKINQLKGFIEEKCDLLVNLGILNPEDSKVINGENITTNESEGYSFSEDFSGNYKKAVAHIQAYLYEKGIYYSRSVIEDFFALIMSNDLIILAGDSGAGKTNLVKSFAEAVGAESIIIPVKPNWTSSEDLLGYYNPLEKKYIKTPFLEALLKANDNPNKMYFICLDEMNLARVEYYFADFLSLLEERNHAPKIHLYSDDESTHLLEEVKIFLQLIDKIKEDAPQKDLEYFIDFLKDEEINEKIHKLCGFSDRESLLNYHGKLRRMLSDCINTSSSISLPKNVRFIGAINIDETTHYLSPKILDRAHIIKFQNPLLQNFTAIQREVEGSEHLDRNIPIKLEVDQFGTRAEYPMFNESSPVSEFLIEIAKEYLIKLGIEFGFRAVRQAENYAIQMEKFDATTPQIIDKIILHKVLPKMMFEGEDKVGDSSKKEILKLFLQALQLQESQFPETDNCISSLEELIESSENNNWIVNYWNK